MSQRLCKKGEWDNAANDGDNGKRWKNNNGKNKDRGLDVCLKESSIKFASYKQEKIRKK